MFRNSRIRVCVCSLNVQNKTISSDRITRDVVRRLKPTGKNDHKICRSRNNFFDSVNWNEMFKTEERYK